MRQNLASGVGCLVPDRLKSFGLVDHDVGRVEGDDRGRVGEPELAQAREDGPAQLVAA
jgi:hypothetical protein